MTNMGDGPRSPKNPGGLAWCGDIGVWSMSVMKVKRGKHRKGGCGSDGVI